MAQSLLRLQRTAGNRAVQRLLRPRIQRAMKFELQTKNRIWRNDGVNPPTLLDRKYGPQDFLVKGSSDVRLESETNGVLEFETEWSRNWPSLSKQLSEAVEMTRKMNSAPSVGGGRKAFPFDDSHLRKGSRREMKRGIWDRKEGFEGKNEKLLGAGEKLEVEVRDASWNAGIQSSESFLLSQYESFLRQHEWPDYKDSVITGAQAVLDAANTKGIAVTELVNLRSMLQIIFNYIRRGQGGPASAAAGAFADVKGLPAKQAFTLMSRTSFSSMYRTLLSKTEQGLFKKIVQSDAILKQLGLDRKSPFFVKGYGKERHHAGPTVHQWLRSIHQGEDLLSVKSGGGLSAAMGRYDVEKRAGKKDTGLVKFETRNTQIGAFKDADEWLGYAFLLFLSARGLRARPTGKGETGLKVFD